MMAEGGVDNKARYEMSDDELRALHGALAKGFKADAWRGQGMSDKVTVTLEERDVAAAISELSAAGRRLAGAVSDATVEKREAILRVVRALGVAHVNPTNMWRIRERPILQLRESARDDGDLIGLIAEVGNVLIKRGQKGFAVRLMDALYATQNHEQAVHILENSCKVRWPQTKTLGGYWRV